MPAYIGIDPGKSGAIAILYSNINCLTLIRNDSTEREIANTFLDAIQGIEGETFIFLEKVNAMPKQGVSSTFKFGQSYGFLRGLVIASKIPFETVTPSKWQGYLACRSKGDKNVTKAKAQELFPNEKITHQFADAILIAEYCRRVRQ